MNSLNRSITLLLVVSIAGMMASILPPFSGMIQAAGTNIYPYLGPDIHFDYFVGACLGLLLGLVPLILPIPQGLRPIFIFCWTIKVMTALFILPIYEYFYGLDLDGYFFFGDMPGMPLTPESSAMGTWHVRMFAWMVFKVIGPSYHGGKILFAFIGFLGIYLTYRGAVRFMKQERPFLLVLTTLAPTCLFWSTTLGKDPIVLFAIGLYAYGCLAIFTDFKAKHLLSISVGIIIASLIRNYFLPIMSIPLALGYITQTRRPAVRLMAFPLIAAAVLYSFIAFSGRMKVDSFDTFIAYQSKVASDWGGGGSSFTLPIITSAVMLPIVAPMAIFTALFRPTLFEAHNGFSLAAAIDNTILLVLFVYALSRSRLKEFFQTGTLWMSSFVVLWSVMYGVGTGNLGAISRFKIQVLPIFGTLLFYLARRRMPAPAAIRPAVGFAPKGAEA